MKGLGILNSAVRERCLLLMMLSLAMASMGGLFAQVLNERHLDLSEWTYHPQATRPGDMGPTFQGDSDVTGQAVSDEGEDESVHDLIIDLGAPRGDSLTFFRSPLGVLPYTESGTYRITWRVRDLGGEEMFPPFRLRHMYGAAGEIGNGSQLMGPWQISLDRSGSDFAYIFDFLDVGDVTHLVGSPEIAMNSVTLYFDVMDNLAGVGGGLSLEDVKIEQIDRSLLLASATVERMVDDEWCSPELVGETGAYNTTSARRVIVQTDSCDHALIIAPGPVGGTLTPSQYGLSPNYLNFNGVGFVPFAPSVPDPDFFRAEFELDFSGSTDEIPLSQTSLTMALFEDDGVLVGQTLGCEVNINPNLAPGFDRNPAIDAERFAVYLSVPDGLHVIRPGALGGLISANVRQIDSRQFGGTLTVNSGRIDSFPEGVLP